MPIDQSSHAACRVIYIRLQPDIPCGANCYVNTERADTCHAIAGIFNHRTLGKCGLTVPFACLSHLKSTACTIPTGNYPMTKRVKYTPNWTKTRDKKLLFGAVDNPNCASNWYDAETGI